MGKKEIAEFWIYRYRYWIGYTILAIALVVVLAIAGLYLPGGISEAEQRSIVISGQLDMDDPTSLTIVNMPYHLLQWATMSLLGITSISIKLPSLVIGFFAAILIMLLLRLWFKTNIAILSSAVALTTGQFLFLAQSGTASILYIFWPVALLLLATLITRGAKYGTLWKILFGITAALSLYTPLSIYVLIALSVAALLHPHLRHTIKKLHKGKVAIATFFAVLLLAPLAIIIYQDPNLVLRLLGIPSSVPLLDNLNQLAQQYFNFMSGGTVGLMTPVFGLGSMLIIGYGLYRLIREHQSVQGHIILVWLILILPILVLNPQFTSITFVPLILLLTTGLAYILNAWYRLFPLNPYARVAGLLPIVVLVGSLTLFGLNRYTYGYHYSPEAVSYFSQDLALLPEQTTILKVASEEREFWDTVGQFNDIEITSQTPEDRSYTASRLAKDDDDTPARIIVSPRLEQADRFYIYEPSEE